MADSTYELQRLSYTHDAMVDLIVANPMISQGDLAKRFGYTQAWISRIIRSDGFREVIARRKAELVDPLILQSIEQRFEALVAQSLEVLEEKMQTQRTAELALKVADLGSRALGYGAKGAAVNIQQNFVVAMPEKARDAKEWLERTSDLHVAASPA